MGKRIPIKTAKDIAKKYNYDQVIIWAQNNSEHIQHVTTFGKSVVDADQACQCGNYIKRKLLGWPANECLVEPTRVRKLREQIKKLEKEIRDLSGAREDLRKGAAPEKRTPGEPTWDDFKHTPPDAVRDLLSLVLSDFPSVERIETWSAVMVGNAVLWARATHLKASDHNDIKVPKKPDFL